MNSQRLKILFSFFAIYVIWGSTYLAIMYGIATIPPWMLTALRFITAGIIMAALGFLKKEKPLSTLEKKIAFFSGACMVLANGLVCVVELWIPSGIAAVVIGAMPIWMMLIAWTLFGYPRPLIMQWAGALIGLGGVAMIALQQTSEASENNWATYAVFILFISSWVWAIGTLIQKKISGLQSPFKFGGLQMAFGGLGALVLSFIFESPAQIPWNSISHESVWALLYLIFFGSIIAFTAYGFLARNVEPRHVSTYALVNPIIAVGLGWLMRDEIISGHFVAATILVLVGLGLLMWKRKTT